MLKDFDKDLSGIDLTAENAVELILKAANERSDGLSNKNTELLTKNAKLNNHSTNEQASSEELAALKATIEQDRLTAKGNYDEALKLKETGFSKTVEELTTKVQAFEAKDRESTVDLAIAEQLKEIRINPLHQDAATGLFKGKTSLVDGKAMIGDQSLSDAIKEWSETDSGKASRLAPDNTGGNANGGTQKSGSGKNPTDIEQRAADINKRFGKV